MIHQIILPKLGTNIEDGVVAKWHKKEGEPVKKGETVLLVETSKAIFEVEAENDGYLRKIFSGEGSRVLFTEPVALLSEEIGEDLSGYFKEMERAAKAKKEKKHYEKKREELAVQGREPLKDAKRDEGEKITATPAAKRLAKETGTDISRIARIIGAELVDEKAVQKYLSKKKIAIYGAGLGAKQAKELLKSFDDILVVGLFDDNVLIKGKEVLGLPVLGGWDDFMELTKSAQVDGVVISLHSEWRRKLIDKITRGAPHAQLPALADRRAILSDGVVLSRGVFVEAGSVIGPDTFIGDGSIIDVGAVVSHDCHIGAHSHLSPGCALSGVVRLEGNVMVGVGASINSQVTVGRNVVITPGSAVVCDLPDDVVASGNPARIIGKSFRGE